MGLFVCPDCLQNLKYLSVKLVLFIHFSFQHFLTMFSGVLAIPLILSDSLCLAEDRGTLAELIGTIFFVAGLVTLLQSTFGVR